MLVNKKGDMTPYDMARKPAKQYPVLLPLIWGGAWALTRQFQLKIDRIGMDGIKPPYLVFATHQGFSDYYIGPLALFPHRAMYVSDMEGFAGFGNWLYRGLGCIPKRRYVSDVSVVKNIQYGLSKGQSVVIYPESRHSNVGTTAYIPKNLGKLAKMMKVPVVVLSAKGSYLANPFWDEEHTRKVPMEAQLQCICRAEKLQEISAKELQTRIEKHLQYDEYRYQQEKGFLVKEPNRGEGLHKALYQCISCKKEFGMQSEGSTLSCTCCGSSWKLSQDGWLVAEKDASKIHIPDWYEWQRTQAIRMLEEREKVKVSQVSEEQRVVKDTQLSEEWQETYSIRVEALPNQYGFVDMGEGELVLNREEFLLRVGKQEWHFPHKNRESVQTEYNYRGKGMCIVLSTKDCCYYLYSQEEHFQPTRFQMIGEYLYQEQNGLALDRR